MTQETLAYISGKMAAKQIPYEFIEFKSSIANLERYWVGEYTDSEGVNEDGMHESTFTLTGCCKGNFITLENDKSVIRNLFPFDGDTGIHANGTGYCISFSGSLPVPTDNDFMKKMQITLNIKEWMV